MNTDQILIILILAGAMMAFAFNRWRTEVVAATALAAAVLTGRVDFGDVFAGYSDPAVITVIEILMLTQLLEKSGLIDRLSGPVLARIASEQQLVLFVTAAGAALSVFMNNIGALAIMLPVVYAGCRRLGVAPRAVLMALSFATLLGGMCSLIGTPANLVVSGARSESLGAPMPFFAFAIAGIPATLAGLAWLAFAGWRQRADAAGSSDHGAHEDPAEDVLFEFAVRRTPGWIGKSLDEVEQFASVQILHVLRNDQFVFARRDKIRFEPGDIAVLCAPNSVFAHLAGLAGGGGDDPKGSQASFEAVVTPSSILLGSTVGSVAMLDGHDIRIVGLRGAHIRADGRFADVTISVGDVLILTGDHQAVARVLEDAGCLMLAARQEPVPGRITPFAALALAAGIILAATQIASPEIAFALSLLAVAVAGQASLSDLLRRLDWRVVLMLASLIPLAHAFERSGAAAQIAMPIIFVAQGSDLALVAAVWGVTTLITPFLNNVATAAIMAPIALAAGAAAGASPDMLLLAVAAGASTDFLTPFGHHNNTVVMGAGGYELRDFLRQGAPLTLITGVVTIVSLILFF